jgi:amidohydrolase
MTLQPSLEQDILRAIDSAQQELIDLSLDIHAHPETNYQEFYSSARLADTLERRGFQVERGVGQVATAFRATLQGGAGPGPTVAVLAEYDALPEIGHGCGHNLIATTAIGAAFGLQAAINALPGTVVILGTPAEEGGGGKIRLIEAGVFNAVDVALSSHPAANRTIIATDIPLEQRWGLAMVGFRYSFRGRAAHAAVAPQNGINALNAVIQLFVGIDALRQHLRDDVRIHGVITDGGKAPNVVPDFAAANFMLRSRDRVYLREVVEKVARVAEGAAQITGAHLVIEPLYPFYEEVRPNQPLARLFQTYARRVGLAVEEPPRVGGGMGASTDFGNVSQLLPAFAISFATSPEPVAFHTPAMTEVARSDLAQERTIAAAKAIALAASDLLANPQRLADARSDFEARGGVQA